MTKRIAEGIRRIRNWLSSEIDRNPPKTEDQPDANRRMLLAGAAAAIACGVIAVGQPTPAQAQLEFHNFRRSLGGGGDDDGHSRRRSGGGGDGHSRNRSRGDHNRRRSRDAHSRRRSRGHGRRRSRNEFRDWNEDCVFTPFGWICF